MVTAPGIKIEPFHYLCTQGIVVDVFEQGKQVTISFAEDGFVPALEEMPDGPVFLVEVDGVALVYPLEDTGQRCLLRLHEEMDVVPHVNIGIQKAVVTVFVNGEELQKLLII